MKEACIAKAHKAWRQTGHYPVPKDADTSDRLTRERRQIIANASLAALFLALYLLVKVTGFQL